MSYDCHPGKAPVVKFATLQKVTELASHSHGRFFSQFVMYRISAGSKVDPVPTLLCHFAVSQANALTVTYIVHKQQSLYKGFRAGYSIAAWTYEFPCDLQ